MPHREQYAGLRPPKETRSNTPVVVESDKDIIQFRSLSAIQALKYGLEKKINRTKGWLYRLLVKEGITLTLCHNKLLLYDGFILLI
jgi:hypothetical protein